MMNTKDYDFSFSGLKTAVLYAWKKQPASAKNSSGVARMAAEVQQAIIDVLIKKTIKAVKDYKAKSLILGGGVSANRELRSRFEFEIRNLKFETKLLIPPTNLSTDNALMVAITGYFHRNDPSTRSARPGRFRRKIEANGNLRIS